MKHLKLIISVICALSLLSGCNWVEKVYSWPQNEQPVGVFTVLIHLDPSTQKLTMLEDFKPMGGKVSSSIRNYDRCQYFNQDNWKCPGVTDHESIEMVHGNLVHHYWGTERDYSAHYRISKQ